MPQPIVLPKKQNPMANLSQAIMQSFVQQKMQELMGPDDVKIDEKSNPNFAIVQPMRKGKPYGAPKIMNKAKQTPETFNLDKKLLDKGILKLGNDAYKISEEEGQLKLTLVTPKNDQTPEQKLADQKELVRFTQEMKQKYKSTSPSSSGLMTDNQTRQLNKDLVGMEEKILANSENEGVRGSINFFNQYSKAPYIYVWKPEEKKEGDWFKTKAQATKVQLPKKNGVQLKAEDIAYTAEQTNKTIEEVLAELGVAY